MWTDATGTSGSWLAADGVLFSGSNEGVRVRRIDVAGGGLTSTIDDVFTVDELGRVFVDSDGALTIRDDESDAPFRFEHGGDVLESLIPLADGTFAVVLGPPATMTGYEMVYPSSADRPGSVVVTSDVVVSRRLVGLDASGAHLWSYELADGTGSLFAMSDDRLLISVGSGSQILAIGSAPEPVTEPRHYEQVIVGPGPDGRDVVFGVQGRNSSGESVVSVVDEAGGRFETIADIDGFSSPHVIPNGDVAYLASGSIAASDRGLDGVTELAGVATATGETRWRLRFEASSLAWTEAGFVVVGPGDRPTLTGFGENSTG